MSRTNPVVPPERHPARRRRQPVTPPIHEMNGSERKKHGGGCGAGEVDAAPNEPASNTILAKLKRCVIVVILRGILARPSTLRRRRLAPASSVCPGSEQQWARDGPRVPAVISP
ncbi:hypothetical protein TcBrA4_0034880 [Trypanosoma cruzi]|nr:hypothetical protein TcBrA4_0034880 [Trypanosoma cruzi]